LQLAKHRIGVEKLDSKTRFSSEEFLPIRVFLLVVVAYVLTIAGCALMLRSQLAFRNRFLPLKNFKSLPAFFLWNKGIPGFRNSLRSRLNPITASATTLGRINDCN
jgi:hypothetical protein